MTTFDFFESPFANSPFGQYWEQEYRIGFDITHGSGSLLVSYLIRDDPKTLRQLIAENDTPANTVRVFLQHDGTWELRKGEITQNLSEIGLQHGQIVRVFGIQAGQMIRNLTNPEARLKLEESYLDTIITDLMVPTEDPKKFVPRIKVLLAEAFAKSDPKLKLPSGNVLLMIINQLKEELGEAVPQLLNAVAVLVDSLKITDPDRWMPLKKDGTRNRNYKPLLGVDPGGAADAISKLMQQLTSKARIKLGRAGKLVWALWEHLYQMVTGGMASLLEGFTTLLATLGIHYDLHNAFMVGLYNGIIGFIADLFRMAAMLSKASASEEYRTEIMSQIGAAVDQFFEKGLYGTIGDFLKRIEDRYAKTQDIYDAAKLLGEDTIAVIETVLMVMGGATILIAVMKNVLKWVRKLAKKAGKSVDDFLKAFDVEDAVREGMEDYGKELDKAAKLKPKVDIKLKGKTISLKGFYLKRLRYIKRNRAEYLSLIAKFKGDKKNFLKYLASDESAINELIGRGFSKQDISTFKAGKVPPKYQVHHKIPLDDGGTNDFDNLVLILHDPYHKALTSYQNKLTRKLNVGEKLEIDWPIVDSKIYP